ncbi:MAG: excinuclease ABC subunit UvrC [Alphaproteobacteria bacterium]|nr:excinuclease ABC subunit UvrC [Alphaproteobacteria bacterium]
MSDLPQDNLPPEGGLESAIRTGVAVVRDYVSRLPDTPGVYRMLSERGDALYVGKAKSLRKRVVSYTNPERLPYRLQRMIALTRSMEFIQTATDVEALLLEANLIKKLKPKFNVLLRDDKSFPYILLTADHDFPQVVKHRGAKTRKGAYFGPFAGAGSVNHTTGILQRAFLLRNCSDNVFANRTRPCLQYHIKRCTGPCVGLVDKAEYAEQVHQAKMFLTGESRAVQDRLAAQMQVASDALDFEKAALLRDRLKALATVQAHQEIHFQNTGDCDVFAIALERGQACIQVFFFRAGANFGNRAYFPRHDPAEAPEDILGPFIAQFYENKVPPREIILSQDVPERSLLAEALSVKGSARVRIETPQRGDRRRMIDFALRNAKGALERHLNEKAGDARLLERVAQLFGLPDSPCRIEIYDNSHISGTNMVGAMVVAGPEGFRKSAYRKFNIRTAGAADDYGMMREVMERRFRKCTAGSETPAPEDDSDGGTPSEDWPDLLLIDGGQGQFNVCRSALEEMGILDRVCLVAIAKGEDRNAGRERFFMEGCAPFELPVDDPVLYYLQRLRDEAHRFAIGSHRARRKQQISASPLDEIAGIGAARKRALLLHFGSAKAVAEAGFEDLLGVAGISKTVARKIYDYFR